MYVAVARPTKFLREPRRGTTATHVLKCGHMKDGASSFSDLLLDGILLPW